MLVVSENGYGKRTPLDIDVERPDGTIERVAVYRVTNRGAKGVKTINITEKTGALVAIKSVNDSDDLIIINKSGITLRLRVEDIKRTLGRATQGVRLINLDKRGDQIASVCCVETDPDEEVDTAAIAPQTQSVDEIEIDEVVEEEEEDVDVEAPDDDVIEEESNEE